MAVGRREERLGSRHESPDRYIAAVTGWLTLPDYKRLSRDPGGILPDRSAILPPLSDTSYKFIAT
jgi:hypothetical protein